MSKSIAFLCLAASLGASALPRAATAADYYDEGRRPAFLQSQEDIEIDGGRARIERRDELRPAGGPRRYPGPVVYDEREGDRGYAEPFPRDGGYRGPFPVERPAAFAYGSPYGDGTPPRRAPYYRPASIPFGSGYGDGYGSRGDVPEVGCTIQQARSVTPLGWQKTVTHRTCYRR